ncbi:hypothetical protein V8D89_001100 [Ganoderma adspersum]
MYAYCSLIRGPRAVLHANGPNGLIDRIIDHLHNNVQTLCACALVRSTWIPTVRFHRFGGSFLDVFNTLLQASPDVAPYVRHIDILNNRSAGKIWPLSSDKFRAICSALPEYLEHVELNYIYLLNGTVGDLLFLWSRLPHLRSFILIGDTRIHGAEIPEEYMRSDTKLFRATELQLLWQVQHFDVIADWLCSQAAPAQLRARSLSLSRTEYVEPIARLLRDVGPALEKLQFDSSSGAAVGSLRMLALYPCTLRQCTNFKELHLYGFVSNHDSGGSKLILCMSQVLAHVGPPGVRTFVFSIYGVIAQLGSMAAAISRNRTFEGLECVVVRVSESNVSGAIVSEDVNTSVRNAFKGFEERELLIVRGARLHGPTQWLD